MKDLSYVGGDDNGFNTSYHQDYRSSVGSIVSFKTLCPNENGEIEIGLKDIEIFGSQQEKERLEIIDEQFDSVINQS